MTKSFVRTILAALLSIVFLFPVLAMADVRLATPSEKRVEVVSDGPEPWTLPFYVTYAQDAAPTLVPAGADRTLLVLGSVMHLIDVRNGVVIKRWILPQRIDNVQVDGERFLVRTASAAADGLSPQTITIESNSPQPQYWMDQSLLPERIAVYEGVVFDDAAHFRPTTRQPPALGMAPRQPLTPKEAERLIPQVQEAARRNPFQPRFGVVLALLMKDSGKKDADTVFRQAVERPTNFFAELFPIAADLEGIGEVAWANVAFEQAYALLWKQGFDPRLTYSILPRLILLYLPYDLRLDIPLDKRAELSDRVYRLGPNVEYAPAAWRILAGYFSDKGDSARAALWQKRADEAERDSGYVWEPIYYIERLIRILAAVVAALVLQYIVLQRRYAPQRRLLRQSRALPWWRLDHRLSIACWDRRDRLVLCSLLLLFWTCAGLMGAFGQAVVRVQSAPYFGGTTASPRIRTFFESLPASTDRSFLIALSLQQAGQLADAERLYRTLPSSSASWNNLGLLQADQGRDREAVESFENALRIEPRMQEATLNLGRPATGYWIDLHQKYRPGGKMLALPSHDTMYRAIRGPLTRVAGNVIMGPFSGISAARAVFALYVKQAKDFRVDVPLPVRLLVAFGRPVSYSIVFFVLVLGWGGLRAPYQKVTQLPGRRHWLLELLIPGTTRAWRSWGGLVLAVAVCGGMEAMFRGMALSGFKPLVRRVSFGLPPIHMDVRFNDLAAWPVDPTWLWTSGPVALAILLVALNAALVCFCWRTYRDPTSRLF